MKEEMMRLRVKTTCTKLNKNDEVMLVDLSDKLNKNNN